jgi:uncharacterized protein (DUF488 family)
MIAMQSSPILWTVGHSNHDFETFASLLQRHDIVYLVDVRSYPYSGFAPHFNRDELKAGVGAHGIRYVFLGMALGGRPQRDEHFDSEGHALYGRMAEEPAFEEAIDGLMLGASDHRLALLCSCGQPRDCHRRLLVGKVMCDRGAELRHILPDGEVHAETSVDLNESGAPAALFGGDAPPWRSTRSASHRRRLSASSSG